MRKGFTLVELLVVTLVIAILAGIVYRIAGVAGNDEKLQSTVKKMQRLENCLSGYYAAFGSYPPVEVHGSRNPFYPVDDYGIQQVESGDPNYSLLVWENVEAACRSQPLAMRMPHSSGTGRDQVKEVSDLVRMMIREDPGYACWAGTILDEPFDGASPGMLSGKINIPDWSNAQVFKFGLMSFLLPRYLLMLGGEREEDPSMGISGGVGPDLGYYKFAQWGTRNNCPCRFDDGVQYEDWEEVYNAVKADSADRWKIELIPSQAICQRWLANLEGICNCGNRQEQLFVYGVNIKSSSGGGWPDAGSPSHLKKMIHSAADSQMGANGSHAQQYVLNMITVYDDFGDGAELFYYSPPPYQSYRLWSAGPNAKTFPPWITDEQIRSDPNLQKHANTIYEWISDDIVHLSN